MPETCENGSKSACAPTLAKPDRIVLDEVDDVDWPGGGYSCSREVGQEVR